MGDDERPNPLRRAVESLAREVERRLAPHRAGHTVEGSVEISLDLPLAGGDSDVDQLTAELDRQIARGVRSIVDASSVLAVGRVYCLRCRDSRCLHAAAPDAMSVLAGWGRSGMPVFANFGQLLLDRRVPEVDRLYTEPPRFVASVIPGSDLFRDVLPSFRRGHPVYVHGAVVAGWYRWKDPDAGRQQAAATFLLVSTGRGPRRQVQLHLAGVLADPEAQASLYSHLGHLPWREPLRWADDVLTQVNEASASRKPPSRHQLAARLDGLLGHFADALGRPDRARRRRTPHGEVRHQRGDRPTRTSLADLASVPTERLLRDPRNQTFIVLGPKGRTHVFRPDGKLVTSVRYPSGTIARRQKSGAWVPVSRERAQAFRRTALDR